MHEVDNEDPEAPTLLVAHTWGDGEGEDPIIRYGDNDILSWIPKPSLV